MNGIGRCVCRNADVYQMQGLVDVFVGMLMSIKCSLFGGTASYDFVCKLCNTFVGT